MNLFKDVFENEGWKSLKDDGDLQLFKADDVPEDSIKDDGDPNFFGRD
jgi:hypothetical protein